MPQFIESIKLLNGQFYNLPSHEERRRNTLLKYFGMEPQLTLSQILKLELIPFKGLYKCRIVYNKDNQYVSFVPYTFKKIQTLKVVRDDSIDYIFKFEDRARLNELYESRGSCDDIVIVKNGWITDASYANVVFKRKKEWITPNGYLLNGTMRQQLLEEGKIVEGEVREKDIPKFESVKLINSMLGFESIEVSIDKIVL
jgi:4-amino-4-deoxychorismate lyase